MQDPLLPKHVAIIMDGNGRWAKDRGYPRFYGHVRGATRVKQIVTHARTVGIRALTLYAFSTENWKRPEDELAVLWSILKKYLKREMRALKTNGIRLHIIGDLSRLPKDAEVALRDAITELSGGQEMVLTFALSYGGRAELLSAAAELANRVARGEITPSQITERMFQDCLFTGFLGDLADVDLMIRTSGEKRLSNFLPWQCSYAEFDFPETRWPDYSVEEFVKSLDNFKMRNRRFGAV